MKSKMKKVVSLVLAMAMVLTMSVTAFAAEQTYTITINNETSGHTYEAYQIFSGTLSDGKLTGIDWGSGVDTTKDVNDTTLIQAIQAIEDSSSNTPFSSCSTAENVADVLAGDEDLAETFADVVSDYLSATATGTSSYTEANTNVGEEADAYYSITNLSAGYYLVKDKDNTLASKDDSYTSYILWLTSNESVTPKSDTPKVIKKVKETNDSTGDVTGWQDAADYDIGDTIPYQLTGTLPSSLSYYTVYKYEFTDTLSKGLTVLTASGADATSSTIAASDVTVTVYANSDDTTGTVVGTSNYTVTLTDYSGLESTYEDGHVLTVSLANVLSLTDAGGNSISVSKDSTIVVTYNAKLNDSANIGSAGNPNEVYLTYSNNPNDTSGGETGKTPKDLVTVFTFNLEVKKVNEKSVALEGATFTLYKYSYEDNDYKEIKVLSTGSTFTFTGLDSGMYKISETVTPTGYNSISDITFEIAATYDKSSDDPQLTALEVKNATSGTTFTVEDTKFTKVSTTITNKSGSVLPSTGGIGTTIFYIVGAILVLGAGVVLVTRRRTAR